MLAFPLLSHNNSKIKYNFHHCHQELKTSASSSSKIVGAIFEGVRAPSLLEVVAGVWRSVGGPGAGGGAPLLRAGAATLLYTVWRLLESCLRPAPAHTIATEPRPPALFLLAKVTCPHNMIPLVLVLQKVPSEGS